MSEDGSSGGRDPARVAELFRQFAVNTAQDRSPLYTALANAIARDQELLALSAHAKRGQPPPNMLFAAVHFLLLGAPDQPLARYYASINPAPAPPEEAFPLFKSFCRDHAAPIRALVAERLVQTAEVARAAAFLPGITRIAAIAGEPLGMIEIGAGAGFNLLLDHYGYDFGRAGDVGADEPLLLLECEAKGSKLPPLPSGMPRIGTRIGIDLHPVDLENADDRRWQEALVWPDMVERLARLRQVIDIARHHRPRVVKGDALSLLPELLREITGPVCVVHSIVLYQWHQQQRDVLHDMLLGASAERVIHRLGLELDADDCALDHLVYDRGASTARRLARCEQHGAWIKWVG